MAVLVLGAAGAFAPTVTFGDEAELALLRAEVAALKSQLAACQQAPRGADTDQTVLSLMRKLGAQQSATAELVTGQAGGPLVLPEALLRSVVPDEYIVLLAADAPRLGSPAQISAAFGIAESQVLHVYDRALNGFAVRLDAAQRTGLEGRSGVVGIARNGRVFSTGARVPGAPPAPRKAFHEASQHRRLIDVYLFDTGIRRAHRDLEGRVRDTGFTFFDNGIAGEDCSGHGTHVAARLAGNRLGASKHAQLTSVKVIDRFGTGDVATVIAGIDWVMAQQTAPKLVNMSLTRMVTEDPSPLDMAVEALIESGAVVVVAAGNAAADVADFTPARVTGAITVGSARGLALSEFSNAGEGVDFYAPGEAVISASIRDVCGVQEMSGTSMAAPFVTGLVADLLASGVAPDEIVFHLRQGATRYETGAFAGETERHVLEISGQDLTELCAAPSK